MSVILPRVRSRRLSFRKKRSKASVDWLRRQIGDPYCSAARRDAYRSRAAYKIIEMDEKWGLLRPGLSVLDLGGSPGGWAQVVRERVGDGVVMVVDRLSMEPIDGVHFLQADFLHQEERVLEAMAGLDVSAFDVILSDMAPGTTGSRGVDHLRIVALCERVVRFSLRFLKPGGTLLMKIRQGGAQGELLTLLRRGFGFVRYVKPRASRVESSEQYLLARDKK